jgi:hypothetical protein
VRPEVAAGDAGEQRLYLVLPDIQQERKIGVETAKADYRAF